MKKYTLEFPEGQAWKIFHMMNEGSADWIENYEMAEDHHSARVCRRAIQSFREQLLDQMIEITNEICADSMN
jgi:hypothetical protein